MKKSISSQSMSFCRVLAIILLNFVIITILCLFASCSEHINNDNGQFEETNENQQRNNDNIQLEETNVDQQRNNDKTKAEIITKKDRIDTIIDNMTLEQKAGQLLMLAFRNNAQGGNLYSLDEYTKNVLKEIQPGGIILFTQNIKNINQTADLIKDFQNQSSIPLFVAVDEEGGIVDRLRDGGIKERGFPNSFDVGTKNDTELAYRLGVAIAEEIASLGFNMNFAPVADVNTNPDNPVIGKRSFGSNQELVAKMVEEEVKGMQATYVSAVIKHFPGHGDTATDTHTGEVIIEHNLERLEKIEYVPFKAGIEVGVDAIMTAHIRTPNISDNEYPATLNKDIITGQLRQNLGFNGLIITDGMEMGAITNYFSTKEAVILAIKAGVDIILIPADAYEAHQAIVEAVENGDISQERINQSLRRILETKLLRGVLDSKAPSKDPNDVINSDEHIKLIKEFK